MIKSAQNPDVFFEFSMLEIMCSILEFLLSTELKIKAMGQHLNSEVAYSVYDTLCVVKYSFSNVSREYSIQDLYQTLLVFDKAILQSLTPN